MVEQAGPQWLLHRASPAAAAGCRAAPPPRAAPPACASRRRAPSSCAAPPRPWAPARAGPSAGGSTGGQQVSGEVSMEGAAAHPVLNRRQPASVSLPPSCRPHQRRHAAAPLHGADVALGAALGRSLALVDLGRKAQRAQRLLQGGQLGSSSAASSERRACAGTLSAGLHMPGSKAAQPRMRLVGHARRQACLQLPAQPPSGPSPPCLHPTCTDSGSGLTLTNMSVLPLPPRHGCSRCVSLELRYGMCPLLVASACNGRGEGRG